MVLTCTPARPNCLYCMMISYLSCGLRSFFIHYVALYRKGYSIPLVLLAKLSQGRHDQFVIFLLWKTRNRNGAHYPNIPDDERERSTMRGILTRWQQVLL